MFRKLVFSAVTFCFLFLSISLCAEIKSLDIACDSAWPPYGFKENGKLTGFAVDVVKGVMKNMGIDATITSYTWKRAEKRVLSGKADALFCASKKAKRMKKCYYPKEPLFDSQYVFFIKKSNSGKLKYDSLEDLKGHKVGVTLGYSYNKKLWNSLKANKNYSSVKSDRLNMKKLAAGKIDYFPCELGTGVSLMKKLGVEDQITFLKKPVIKKPYFIIFNKQRMGNSTAFVEKFSQALKEFKKTDAYKKIYTKYLGG